MIALESRKTPSYRRPYLEPALDRWKIAVLGVLFFLMLLSAMAWFA